MTDARKKWFKEFRERAKLTSKNLRFLQDDVVDHSGHLEEHLAQQISDVSIILESITKAKTNLQRYRAMERLAEFDDTPSLIQLGLLSYASTVLSRMNELEDIDGTREAVKNLELSTRTNETENDDG